jgi:hypothetical protein
LVVMVCLVLASSVNQFLLAQELTDYAEQFAVATKTLLNQGQSIEQSERILLNATSTRFRTVSLSIQSVKLLDSKTVEVIACKTWRSPLPIVALEQVICEKALSR